MILRKRVVFLNNISKHVTKCSFGYRYLCSSKSLLSVPGRVVLISSSDKIYENLALEEWIYEQKDLSVSEYLFMWKNRPAIVCGRHQNPWLEANIPLATSLGLDVARRSSGGGTVYHDEGNLNLSFLKSRTNYNRRKNLDLVVQAITERWDVDLTVNDRDDILLNKLYKVSGTAAKLGRLQSYHHFTLLHSVNQELLQHCLQSPMQGANSKATKSFPSSVMNLADQEPDINFHSLVSNIGQHFLEEVEQKISPETFCFINPLNDAEFPGVPAIVHRLQTWDWCFGKSPDFSIERKFAGPAFKSKPCSMQVKILVKKGILTLLTVDIDDSELAHLQHAVHQFCLVSSNFPLTRNNVENFKEAFYNCLCESNSEPGEYISEVKWIIKCIESCLNFL